MERRDVLKSASAVAAASTVGLAGCSGILGGGCSKPKDDFEDSLPDSDDYEEQGDPEAGEGSEDTEEAIFASYAGPDDEFYFFSIAEFSSEDAAEEGTEQVSEGSGESEGASGYIRVGKYIYAAGGPGEDELEEFMKASPTISDGCVNNNLETS